jgi:hypothetical protein
MERRAPFGSSIFKGKVKEGGPVVEKGCQGKMVKGMEISTENPPKLLPF